MRIIPVFAFLFSFVFSANNAARNKIVVIGGSSDKDAYTADVEIVDLSMENRCPDGRSCTDGAQCTGGHSCTDGHRCAKPPDYPLGLEGTVGTVLDGAVTICGGRDADQNCYSDCYFLNATSNQWVKSLESLPVPKHFHSAVNINGSQWMIVGGSNEIEKLASVEQWKNGHFSPLDPFTEPVDDHCLIQVNETHLFLAGGRTDSTEYSDSAHLYSIHSGQWEQLPSFDIGRISPFCTTHSGPTANPQVVIAGGKVDGGFTATSEVLELGTLDWSRGPDLPLPVGFAFSLQPYELGSPHLMLGGYLPGEGSLDSILKLESGQWVELPVKLAKGRNGAVAVAVDETMLHCS